MSAPNRFRVYTPQVTHETIDGEVVIINLDNGSYYSMNNAGAVIWDLLGAGMPVEQIVEVIARSYSGDPREIETGVTALVEKLQQESLIVSDNGTRTDEANGAVVVAKSGAELPPFECPVLHKYTDMEDLLLLDPIHEVDDAGWPHKNQDAH